MARVLGRSPSSWQRRGQPQTLRGSSRRGPGRDQSTAPRPAPRESVLVPPCLDPSRVCRSASGSYVSNVPNIHSWLSRWGHFLNYQRTSCKCPEFEGPQRTFQLGCTRKPLGTPQRWRFPSLLALGMGAASDGYCSPAHQLAPSRKQCHKRRLWETLLGS